MNRNKGIRTVTRFRAPALLPVPTGILFLIGTSSKGEIDKPAIVSNEEEAVSLFGAFDAQAQDLTLPKALKSVYRKLNPRMIVMRIQSQTIEQEGVFEAENLISSLTTELGALRIELSNLEESIKSKKEETAENPDDADLIAELTSLVEQRQALQNCISNKDAEVEEARANLIQLNSDIPNIVGEVSETGARSGLEAIFANETGLVPDTIIAPYFTGNKSNRDRLIEIGAALEASTFHDLAPANKNEAILESAQYGASEDHRYGMAVWPPYIKDIDGVDVEHSGSVLNAIASLSREYYDTVSSFGVDEIKRLKYPVSYSDSTIEHDANDLFRARISTFINDEGWITWGNRTLARENSDFTFISTVKIENFLKRVVKKRLKFVRDKQITGSFVDTVLGPVNSFLRGEISRSGGVLLNARGDFRAERNPTGDVENGKVVFTISTNDAAIAEDIVFEFEINSDNQIVGN